MKKFIILYHASPEAMSQMSKEPPSEEAMKPWMEWAKKCGRHLIDLGSPLMGGQRIAASSSTPSDKGVVGYSILEAKNMDEAKSLLNGHPHLGWHGGCDIEIHESIPM